MEGTQDEPAVRPRRYDVEELKYLKNSPHVVKPPGLPPSEQWMGPPAESTRNSAKLGLDRTKSHDSSVLLDGTPRRPGTERHMSRNSANPEDIILGPPKTSFLSAVPFRNASKGFESSDRPPLKEADSRDRFNFRQKFEGDGDRSRDTKHNLRSKRADGDQDSDGWIPVKPRKSFGTEGAERFNGRMGVDRHREDRRVKDRDERDVKERPRGFDTFSRDNKETMDHEQDREPRKNGTGRGRNEPTWFRDRDSDVPPTPKDRTSNGDRLADRSRGWREKDRDEKADRDTRTERRWDKEREQRPEQDPEWFAQPLEEKINHKKPAHSQEEFQRWKDEMSGKDKPTPAPADALPTKAESQPFFGLEKKAQAPLESDAGPDKFFGKWSALTPRDEVPPELGQDSKKEFAIKAKTVGKASRFTSFFHQEDAQRRPAEVATPADEPNPPNVPNALVSLLQGTQGNIQGGQGGPGDSSSNTNSDEKQAFAMLLQKLKSQTGSGSGSTPPANALLQPKAPAMEKPQSAGLTQENFQQYRTDLRQEETRNASRNPQILHDLQSQRLLASSQPTGRPNSAEQILQDLVGQRQNATSQSSLRVNQQQQNDHTEFLMGLMKRAPEPQRSEEVLLRMPPKQNERQIQHQQQQQQQQQQQLEEMMRREAAAQRERSASQRQIQSRQQPPPGFDDYAAFQRGNGVHERQPPQPTQILPRPAPPGLDLGWERQAQLPPQHRIAQNIAPPPGLANGPGPGPGPGPTRMPMPQQMFPPYMGAFPPPDVMAGPPRNMPMQPPPGFYNAPPPGFIPPGMSGFQGPEGMAFGGPFDGRGPPPQGGFRRQ